MGLIKNEIKRIILRQNHINIDNKSNVNLYMKYLGNPQYPASIVNSNIHIANISEGVFIENATGYGDISIGRYSSISGPGTILHSEISKIKIGSFCSIAQNVSIQSFNHNYHAVTTNSIGYNIFNKKFDETVISKGDICIEDDVWVGSNVVILSGVTIGRGSIIGAGSVVTKDIPRYSIAFGSPAKCYKKKFNDETIEFLENLKWWDWDTDKILKNKNFFERDIDSLDLSDLKALIL